MPIFEYVLILLALVCLSNLINRFIPVISVPIVQIALGALFILYFDFQIELEPSLFFALFVAPLIFYVSLLMDKKTLWAQRRPILSMGIVLVFAIVITVGFLLNFLIPSIPLAAAFALIAALGPTDDVAIASVSKRVNVPPKIMNILQGESIINDVSGIISFQFALAAMLSGSFSLVQATGQFLIVGVGGILVGVLLTWLKFGFVRWIRSLGMENVTLHLLFGILTPFVVYLVAEKLGVSGILAIFAAGIAHSFNRNKFNPDMVNYKIADDSIWSMLSFTLEGLVFVILGTQLPKILSSINQNFSITTGEIISYILLITFLFLLSRFLWSLIFVRKKTYHDPKYPVSRLKASILFSLSGARGTVTLACVMSIPPILENGKAFPEHDLIILIAGGVIVISLIITSFILPLFVDKKIDVDKSAENEAYLEILQNVMTELKKQVTEENEEATAIITANYYKRSAELKRKHYSRPVNRDEERRLRITICEWERENVAELLESGETDKYSAQYYIDILDSLKDRYYKNRFVFRRSIMRFLHKHSKMGGIKNHVELRNKVLALMEVNAQFVLEKLKIMDKTEDSPAIKKLMAEYELHSSMFQRGWRHNESDNKILVSVVSYGFQIERDNIQTMLEAGRISKETAREIRHNISLLEVQLKKEYF